MALFEIKRNDNGREQVIHDGRLPASKREPEPRVLVSQAIKIPGREDNALMVGHSYLRRDQVEELRDRLNRWIEAGTLALDGETIVDMAVPAQTTEKATS